MFLNQDIIGILFHFLSDFPFMIFFLEIKAKSVLMMQKWMTHEEDFLIIYNVNIYLLLTVLLIFVQRRAKNDMHEKQHLCNE